MTRRRTGSVLLVVGHSSGGIGGHVASLAAGLPARGWTVRVATSAVTSRAFAFGAAPVERVWPSSAPLRAARGLVRLRGLVAAVDVVHAHGHQAGLLAVLAAATLPRRRRPPVAVSWHNAVLGGGPGRWLRGLLERLQVRRADLVTGASADLVEHAAALGATRAVLAPVAAPAAAAAAALDRGTRDSGRAALGAELGVDPGTPWVLTVSRIAPQKNLDVVVAAAARLAARREATWLLVGSGDAPLLQRLRAEAGRQGAPLRFLGARSDVPALMGLADVLALASSWEARALVVQEAMAAGLPVVVTAVGGLPELVGDAGVLVPPGDAAALAEGVAAVLDDRGRAAALAEAGRARYAQLPGEQDVVSAWADRYSRLLA